MTGKAKRLGLTFRLTCKPVACPLWTGDFGAGVARNVVPVTPLCGSQEAQVRRGAGTASRRRNGWGCQGGQGGETGAKTSIS